VKKPLRAVDVLSYILAGLIAAAAIGSGVALLP
jgi:hypothetical protein